MAKEKKWQKVRRKEDRFGAPTENAMRQALSLCTLTSIGEFFSHLHAKSSCKYLGSNSI
jgi:hypothetical protein